MSVDSAERMAAQLAVWNDTADGRSIFLDCYQRMTGAVIGCVDDGRFADGEWVLRLLDRFADYYFDSIDGGAQSTPVPEPWVLAHAAAVGHDANALQLLLAGVNAHINFDLVLTLVDVLDAEWSEADSARRALRRSDFELINSVIAETADLVQDEVIERRAPWLDLLDRSLGRWDERAAVVLLSRWRARVWRQAVDMLDRPESRDEAISDIERQCVRRARWLLL